MNSWIFTPAFCKPELMEDFLSKIEVPKGFYHVMIYDHYPIKKEKNKRAMQQLAKQYGCLFLDSGMNLGLHHALNYGMNSVHVQKTDFYINCDADDRPSPGLFEAMKEVMGAKKKLAILGCSFGKIQPQIDLLPNVEDIAGHRVIIHPTVDMWNISAINLEFLDSAYGFNEPYAYYGGLESHLYQYWPRQGLRLGYLKDFRSDHTEVAADLVDPEFREYKTAHAKHSGYTGSFESYLRDFYPHLL